VRVGMSLFDAIAQFSIESKIDMGSLRVGKEKL
jgi:hypothetical protein